MDLVGGDWVEVCMDWVEVYGFNNNKTTAPFRSFTI